LRWDFVEMWMKVAMATETQDFGKPTLGHSDLIPILLIGAVIAATSVPFIAGERDSFGLVVVSTALVSLWGLAAIHLRQSTTWLWAAVGLDLLGGFGLVWFFGGTLFLGAALMIA
jgi:hypothetical protein